MGLLLLESRDYNLIYEYNKGNTLRIMIMKSKKRPKKTVVNPFKVVLVEQGTTIITHIYRNKENFRLDEKARYDKVIARIIEKPEQHYGH